MAKSQDRLIGRTLGRYQIEALAGKGGLATVYRANDLLWEMPVAMKVLPEFFASDDEHRQRFQREASTMANLVHPNIMPVREYDQVEGTTFFVMDYADGGTLTERMGKPLTVDEMLEIMRPIADGVSYAHSRSVVHRDLKPSNVLYNDEGRALIADFGIAKLMEESGLTHTRESLGTPDYMAPEQAREAALVGPPADVYALGVIIFQLLTGQTPYQGGTTSDIIEKHKYSPIPSPRAYGASLPAGFDDFFQRVLAKDPAVRTQTVEEMMSLLLIAASGEALPPDPRYQAPPPPPPQSQPPGAMATPATPHPQTYYPPQQRRGVPWWVWVLGFLAVVVIGVVIYLILLLLRPETDKIYAEGLECSQTSDWACCTVKFQNVLSLDPDYRDTAERLATCQHRWDWEVAKEKLKSCLSDDWECIREASQTIITEFDRTDATSRMKFANASYALANRTAENDPEQALQILQEVAELGITNVPGGFNELSAKLESYLQGIEAFGKKDYEDAIDLLTPIQSFSDSAERIYTSNVRLCNAAVDDGDPVQARRYAQDAQGIERNGDEVLACLSVIQGDEYAAQLAIGLAYLEEEEWEQAIGACEAALVIDSAGSDANDCIEQAKMALYEQQMVLGQSYIESCSLDDAISVFSTALDYKPNDPAAKAGLDNAKELNQFDSERVADSVNGWSSAQSQNGWFYLARQERTEQQISYNGDGHYGGGYYWNPDVGSRIQQKNQHPDNNMTITRRWVSTINGIVTIALTYSLESSSGNTILAIQKNDQQLNSWSATSSRERTVQIPSVSITKGDNIDLIVNSNGGTANDNTMVHMTIFRQVPRCQPQ